MTPTHIPRTFPLYMLSLVDLRLEVLPWLALLMCSSDDWAGRRHEACLQVHVLDARDPWNAKPVLVHALEEGVECFLEHHEGTFYMMTNACEGREMCIVQADPSDLPKR